MKKQLALFIPLIALALFGLVISIVDQSRTVFYDLLFFIVVFLIVGIVYYRYLQKQKGEAVQHRPPPMPKNLKSRNKTIPLAKKRKQTKPYPLTVIEGNKGKKHKQSP